MISTSAPRKRIAVVVNGNAKAVTEEVLATLDRILDAGDLFVSRSVREVEDIAQTILDRGYDTVLTGGGDGTFTCVVTGIVKVARRRGVSPPRFGLLRLGTGNSLAWVVGASRAAAGRGLLADLERLRTDAGVRLLRLVEVEGILAPFCGFGYDADVLSDYLSVRDFLRRAHIPRKWTAGVVSYGLAAGLLSIPKHLVMPLPFVRVTNLGGEAYKIGEGGRPLAKPVRTGERLFEGQARMVSTSTIPYYGFGFRVFPHADERPDRMALRIATLGPIEFVRNARALWRGEYSDPTRLMDWLVERVRIEVEPDLPFQVGGDAMGQRRSVEVSLSSEPIELADFYAPPRG